MKLLRRSVELLCDSSFADVVARARRKGLFMKRGACVSVLLAVAACGGDRSGPVAPAAIPPPDFEVSCRAATAARGCANSICTLTSRNGFAGSVSLSCSSATPGITCGFGPNPLTVAPDRTANAGFTVGASWVAASRTSMVEVTAMSGGRWKTTTVTVSVGTVPRPAGRRMWIVGCAGYAAGVLESNEAFRQVIVGAWRDTWGGRFCNQTVGESDGYFEISPSCFSDAEPVYLTAGGIRSCAAPPYQAGATAHTIVIGRRDGVCR